MKKNIVIATNPFGFGPLGNTLPILKFIEREFASRTNAAIYFLCSQKLKGQVSAFKYISVIDIDERNELAIEQFLSKLQGETLVIGVQNRFTVEIAKRLGSKSFFIDVLAWMWEPVPAKYLEADEVFWMRFPGIYEKRSKNLNANRSIQVVEGIYDYRKRRESLKKKKILLSVGGGFNPLRGGIQTRYLMLLLAILEGSKISSSNLLIAAGEEVINFLQGKVNRKRGWQLKTLGHDELLNEVSESKYFLSVGGQSSTIEALLSRVPTFFFLPSNYSQYALQVKLSHEINMDFLWWKSELDNLSDQIESLSEYDFIERLESLSEKILQNPNRVDVLVSKFDEMISSFSREVEYSSQLFALAKWIGSEGVSQLFERVDLWLKKSSST